MREVVRRPASERPVQRGPVGAAERSGRSAYRLRCQACGWAGEDDGFRLECPREHEPSLLLTEYEGRWLEPDTGADGIFRYRNWLPAIRTFTGVGGSITYRSEALCKVVGLPNLWVVFSGHWPERGATLTTATFKELEAWAVLSRLPRQNDRVMVVASAGNTAAAFAWACSATKVPIVIVVPETALSTLQFADELDPCVRIVCLCGSSDYADAITLANRVAALPGFFPEGGVKNVGRLDGLGTTMLNATETIGRLPDYYLQAIGSGAGAIAAFCAAKRLADDGRFGKHLPRLILSQNLPFVPIYLSWKSARRELVEIEPDDGKRQIQQLFAEVLSNRRPPYSVRGGVYDVLTESDGDMLVADNFEAIHASGLFEETEGIDIDAAGAVAFATLLKAARTGWIERDAVVLLNITGGGRHRHRRQQKLIQAVPELQLGDTEVSSHWALERIGELVR